MSVVYSVVMTLQLSLKVTLKIWPKGIKLSLETPLLTTTLFTEVAPDG